MPKYLNIVAKAIVDVGKAILISVGRRHEIAFVSGLGGCCAEL